MLHSVRNILQLVLSGSNVSCFPFKKRITLTINSNKAKYVDELTIRLKVF